MVVPKSIKDMEEGRSATHTSDETVGSSPGQVTNRRRSVRLTLNGGPLGKNPSATGDEFSPGLGFTGQSSLTAIEQVLLIIFVGPASILLITMFLVQIKKDGKDQFE